MRKFHVCYLCEAFIFLIIRSSRPEVFCEKGVLRNFAKFTEKHLCQSLFFSKATGGACNFIKKEALAQVFSREFCEISENTFFYRTPLLAASVLYCLHDYSLLKRTIRSSQGSIFTNPCIESLLTFFPEYVVIMRQWNVYKLNWLFNDIDREKLWFAQFIKRIYWNRGLVVGVACFSNFLRQNLIWFLS